MNNKKIRTIEALAQHQFITNADIPELKKVVETFSLSISEQMQQLIDKTNPHDPIAKQFLPDVAELNISETELSDPIGDDKHTTVRGIVHRYPDRCLFTPVHVCPVYCRFCFRREQVGTDAKTLSLGEFEHAFSYINDHSEIWEVIITGGDPLILKPAIIKNIMEKLVAIDHVEVIRIHTRIPVVESQRITSEMIAAIKCVKPVYVVLHANHPKEFTPEARSACAALIDAGIPMLSQTVLLKNINNDIHVLSELMRCFVKNRIKPYYLHQGDLAKGTQHFRTTIAEGQALMKQLRGRFSGICQPTYVLDIPGGHGKAPIGPNYICPSHGANGVSYTVEDYLGHLHAYPEL